MHVARSINLGRKLLVSSAAVALLGAAGIASAQAARDYISIVGSSTVYPFTTTVAEKFGRQGSFKTPKVESTGTGGGIKLFCNGVGVQHPDAANASRRMNAGEFETCRKNGVTDIVEVKVGYDGLTIAESKKSPIAALTRKQVYLALAKQIPDPANPTTLIANPYTTWKDVDPSLPAIKIEVLGPPPTSGTRDSFHELYMEVGCRTYPWINTMRGMDEKRFKRICHTMREDGAFIEAGENDNLIVQKIEANPNALGIFGYSFLEENQDKLRGTKIDGVAPSFETISSGTYAPSRPLFIYVKKAHIGVIPGLKEFIDEYVSEKALGDEGYLAERGLVPQPKSDLAKTRADVKTLKTFTP
jgi:phosphate transport system substrate-binding protein